MRRRVTCSSGSGRYARGVSSAAVMPCSIVWIPYAAGPFYGDCGVGDRGRAWYRSGGERSAFSHGRHVSARSVPYDREGIGVPKGNWRAGVDIGGTFTDLLLVDEQNGRFRVGKVLTTASEPAAGVRGALTDELQSGDLSADALGTLVHGTTLVTNAVIERKGATTALLITEGSVT